MEILQADEKNGDENIKIKFPKIQVSKVDDIIYTQVCQMRAKRMPISGPLIKEKAKEVACEKGILNFTASNGEYCS